ncbi:MAG: AraC family transcriptional regulator, partial [Paracoccus sp. (in: a-proteobacteria)]|nr:AraC family transcriptional regulator [Paracoccus sp. (in: a-proteobacteria)]
MQGWVGIMQIWKADPGTRQVGVLLFDDFSNHCLANAVEPLRAANTLARKQLYAWTFLSIDGSPAVSSSGLPVTPQTALAGAAGDDLFIMPSYGFRTHASRATIRALRGAAHRWNRIAGLDTGAWLMAAAGLLKGCRATIHWDELNALADAFPDLDVVPDRFVIDGNRLSSGGVTTTFDLVLHLIRQAHGPMLALEVASLFMLG